MLTRSLAFLEKIKHNNNKMWMQENKPAYQVAREEFIDFTREVIQELSRIDDEIAELDPKKCIFRINRDIRFSKDKSLYKTNFGMFLAAGGKKSGQAGYYFHLEPGDNSFIAGGLYAPDNEKLAKVRQEIDYNPEPLKKISEKKIFKNLFDAIQGDTLKRPPKGYPDTHPNIELLKLKSIIVIHHVTDQEIINWSSPAQCVAVFSEIKPLNDYLNVAIS